MANQIPDLEAARDLKALPTELQTLYHRLAADGDAWQAASTEKLSALAQSMDAYVERLSLPATAVTAATEPQPQEGSAPVPVPIQRGVRTALSRRRRWYEWVLGTVAAVVVVGLLALALHGAIPGRGTTGPTSNPAGWQILDKLTLKGAPWYPIIAPSDPRVVYEVTRSTATDYALLRRTENGGETWQNLALPVPIEYVYIIELRVSPLNARVVFMSIYDRSGTACEPTTNVLTGHEGCIRGYVSTDAGDTWQKQRLPVPGVLDNDAPHFLPLAQGSRLYWNSECNGDSCSRLLSSDDGGLTWRAVDGWFKNKGYTVCDFAAPASGQTIYAEVSRPGCMQSQSANTLWRSDDAGAEWTQVSGGAEWTQVNQALDGTLLVSSDNPSLLYLGNPDFNADYTHVSFRYSLDSGSIWRETPKLATADNRSEQVNFWTQSSAVLSDGTLVVAVSDTIGQLTLFTWKPGERAWQRLTQVPFQVNVGGYLLVLHDASGRDVIYVAGLDGNSYHVARYQL